VNARCPMPDARCPTPDVRRSRRCRRSRGCRRSTPRRSSSRCCAGTWRGWPRSSPSTAWQRMLPSPVSWPAPLGSRAGDRCPSDAPLVITILTTGVLDPGPFVPSACFRRGPRAAHTHSGGLSRTRCARLGARRRRSGVSPSRPCDLSGHRLQLEPSGSGCPGMGSHPAAVANRRLPTASTHAGPAAPISAKVWGPRGDGAGDLATPRTGRSRSWSSSTPR
jgi:hypothetical protein